MTQVPLAFLQIVVYNYEVKWSIEDSTGLLYSLRAQSIIDLDLLNPSYLSALSTFLIPAGKYKIVGKVVTLRVSSRSSCSVKFTLAIFILSLS